jgi:hypothetical protein
MDFHQLLAKMQELDSPAVEQPTAEQCGMPPPSIPPMGTPPKPDIPPPSVSVNLNAQGMDNIEQMMQLFQKVNPDMMPPAAPPMPSLAPLPGIMSIKPELPPLKMLPDFDADNDDKIGGEKDSMMKVDLDKDDDEGSQPGGLATTLDRDNDSDHDMDDHDLEKKDKKQESRDDEWEEGSLSQFVNTNDYNFEMEYSDDWDAAEDEFVTKVKKAGHKVTDVNRDASPVIVAMDGDDFVAWYDFENIHGFIKPVGEAWDNEPEPEIKDIGYMVNKLAGGMNKGHDTFPKVSDGDNPMQRIKNMEGEDLRSQIRDELRSRLAEAKGAK